MYKGSITFYNNKHVQLATLASLQKVQGYWFQEGKPIEFYDNGNVRTGVSGKENRDGPYTLKKNSPLWFFKSSNLRAGILSEPHTIECGLIVMGPISFYESQEPHYVTLAKDQRYKGKDYRQYDSLKLDRNARVLGSSSVADRIPSRLDSLPPE